MKKILLLILIFTTLSFCFAKGKADTKVSRDLSNAPDWVTGKSKSFPNAFYITGVGCAMQDDGAENQAKSEVLKSIYMKIESDESYSLNASTSSEEANYQTTIHTATALEEISGIRIAKKYSANDGSIYALAVLNRQDTADYYAKLLHKNETKITENLTLAFQNVGTLKSINYADTATSLARNNEYYLYLITALAPMDVPDTTLSYKSTASVLEEASVIRAAVRVAIQILNDSKNTVYNAFYSIFTKYGIFVTDIDDAGYILKADVALEPVETSDTKHYYTYYSLVADLTEKATGSGVLSFFTDGRAGHVTKKSSEQRALLSISDDVKKKFGENLEAKIAGK